MWEYAIGLDLSQTSAGVVVVNRKGEIVLTTTAKSSRKGPARLADIRDRIQEVVRTWKPGPVCQENYAFGSKFGREQAGELGGVIKVMLWEEGITPTPVSPNTLKLFATGNGHAAKEDIKLAVYKNWGADYLNCKNDEADAYVLARIALALGQEEKLTSEQKRAMKTVLEARETDEPAATDEVRSHSTGGRRKRKPSVRDLRGEAGSGGEAKPRRKTGKMLGLREDPPK